MVRRRRGAWGLLDWPEQSSQMSTGKRRGPGITVLSSPHQTSGLCLLRDRRRRHTNSGQLPALGTCRVENHGHVHMPRAPARADHAVVSVIKPHAQSRVVWERRLFTQTLQSDPLPKHHALSLSKHLKKTNSGLKRNSLSCSQLPGLWAEGFYVTIFQDTRDRRNAGLEWPSRGADGVRKGTEGAFHLLSGGGDGMRKPALASLDACEEQYRAAVTGMGSEARGGSVQVPAFPFTTRGVLWDVLWGWALQFLHLWMWGDRQGAKVPPPGLSWVVR